jgi:hypothetical protein
VGIMTGMSIGQAAERSGCTVATVRHYEDEGLLKGIGRAPNGRRVYGFTFTACASFAGAVTLASALTMCARSWARPMHLHLTA